MKNPQTIDWFKTFFQVTEFSPVKFVCHGTINGMDYSFPSDSEENAWLLAEAYLIKNGHLHNPEINKLNNKIAALEDELKRNKLRSKEFFIDQCQQHKSQLMSVYYMLEAVSKTGTHREKRIIIDYQKVVISDLVSKGDSLPLHIDDESDLPF